MKMDKREIILCLLFACLFITMIFIRAFAVDAADPVNVTTLPHHGKQAASEILADDTSYNSWLSELQSVGADVASNVWSTASDMARNLLAYGVGCVANVSEEVLQVAFPDLEHYLGDMYFDWDSLEWEFTTPDDVEEFIKTGLDPYAYDYPSSVVKRGNWYKVTSSGIPIKIPAYSSNILTYTCNGDGWICVASGKTFIASFNSPASFTIVEWNSTDVTNLTYQGSVSSGYYKQMGSPASLINGETPTAYSTYHVALSDLFGNEWVDPSPDPVLNGDVIYFDDPKLEPLGYYPSTGLDFTKIVNEGNTNNYDYSVVNNYNTYYPTTYTFDIPYWLKVPSTVPKIYDLPSDYDYGNIQFDYEADSSFLDGAGLVQDVYDILPSQLQNLIILFGAGTCAFIFLRR